jgi:hypothetical protein
MHLGVPAAGVTNEQQAAVSQVQNETTLGCWPSFLAPCPGLRIPCRCCAATRWLLLLWPCRPGPAGNLDATT